MEKYSEQDLRYAAEFRDEIHREALAEVRKVYPEVDAVIDRYPVESYFQEHWDYPGKWYTIVAVPGDCGGRWSTTARNRPSESSRAAGKRMTQQLRSSGSPSPRRMNSAARRTGATRTPRSFRTIRSTT